MPGAQGPQPRARGTRGSAAGRAQARRAPEKSGVEAPASAGWGGRESPQRPLAGFPPARAGRAAGSAEHVRRCSRDCGGRPAGRAAPRARGRRGGGAAAAGAPGGGAGRAGESGPAPRSPQPGSPGPVAAARGCRCGLSCFCCHCRPLGRPGGLTGGSDGAASTGGHWRWGRGGGAEGGGAGWGRGIRGGFPSSPWRLCAWPCAALRGWLRGSGRSSGGAGAAGPPGERPALVACCPLRSFPLDRGRTGVVLVPQVGGGDGSAQGPAPRGAGGGQAVLGRKGAMAGTGEYNFPSGRLGVRL